MRQLFFILGFGAATIITQQSHAQFYVAPGTTYFVKANTELNFDSLVLVPNTDFSLSAVTVSKSYIPVTGITSGASIAKVYTTNAPISFTGTIGLYYDISQLNGNNPGMLEMAYSDGTTWTVASGSLVNQSTRFVSKLLAAPAVLAKVTAITNGAVLSVHVIDFTARADGRRSRIEWTTANEQNIHHYSIYHSTNGVNYTLLKTIPATNHPEEQQYLVYDNNPGEGVNYYRLTETDITSAETYIGTRTVKFGKLDNPMVISMYPNPVRDILTVEFSEEASGDLVLADMSGRTISRMSVTGKRMVVGMQDLASGVYILSYKGQQTESFKLEKL